MANQSLLSVVAMEGKNEKEVAGNPHIADEDTSLIADHSGAKQPAKHVKHIKGKTYETTNKILPIIRQRGDIYRRGRSLTIIRDNTLLPLSAAGLDYILGQEVQFISTRYKDGMIVDECIDPPSRALKQILENIEIHDLEDLNAVITAPVITRQGRYIYQPGYDTETKLFLAMADVCDALPFEVTPDQVHDALRFLMSPFKDFSVASPLDRSALLALLLTAIVRPILPTAPAGGIDAPVQGSGKTLLAECIGTLATGTFPNVYPHVNSQNADEEIRKRLQAIMSSGTGAVIWDNVIGDFNSTTLAGLLTSSTYTDRLLGTSKEIQLPNRFLLIFTGNNLTFTGDMPRRVLTCRIDAGIENPATRRFDRCPKTFVQNNRQNLVIAGLTLIRAYLESDDCKTGGAVPNESTASFSDWDYLVRQTVAWIAKIMGESEYVDPAKAFKQVVSSDPELQTLGEMLSLLQVLTKGEWFTAKDLVRHLAAPPPEHLHIANDLSDSLQDLAGNRKIETSLSLGRVLSYRVDRHINGKVLKRQRAGNKLAFKVGSSIKAEEQF